MQPIQRAIKKHKLAVIAKACKVSPQAVFKWGRKGVPANRVLDVERFTGISRYDLRPDVFGKKPKST